MTDHVRGKPRIGTFVDYYNPLLMQKIGFTEGYGKRGAGPYAAVVSNNLGNGCTLLIHFPGVTPVELESVPHKDKAPAIVNHDGTNHPAQNGNGYWDWQNQAQAMRAAKEMGGARAEGDA